MPGAITLSCFKATFWQTPTSTRLHTPFSSEFRDICSESLKSSHSEDVCSREQTCPHTAVRKMAGITQEFQIRGLSPMLRQTDNKGMVLQDSRVDSVSVNNSGKGDSYEIRRQKFLRYWPLESASVDKEPLKLPTSLGAGRRHMESFKEVHLSRSTQLFLPARGPAMAGHHTSCGPSSFFPPMLPL